MKSLFLAASVSPTFTLPMLTRPLFARCCRLPAIVNRVSSTAS
ncbi:hypothetical protein [Variovorax sp. ZT4R33]